MILFLEIKTYFGKEKSQNQYAANCFRLTYLPKTFDKNKLFSILRYFIVFVGVVNDCVAISGNDVCSEYPGKYLFSTEK